MLLESKDILLDMKCIIILKLMEIELLACPFSLNNVQLNFNPMSGCKLERT